MSVLGLELSTDNIYSLVLSCHDCSFSLYYHMCSAALRYHPHSVASFRCTPPQRSSPLPQVPRAPLRCLNCGATLCCHKKTFPPCNLFSSPSLRATPALSCQHCAVALRRHCCAAPTPAASVLLRNTPAATSTVQTPLPPQWRSTGLPPPQHSLLLPFSLLANRRHLSRVARSCPHFVTWLTASRSTVTGNVQLTAATTTVQALDSG